MNRFWGVILSFLAGCLVVVVLGLFVTSFAYYFGPEDPEFCLMLGSSLGVLIGGKLGMLIAQ